MLLRYLDRKMRHHWSESCKDNTHVKAVERPHFLFLLNNDYGFVAKPLPFVVA